eukprot:2532471-Rhodomonas_salina.1
MSSSEGYLDEADEGVGLERDRVQQERVPPPTPTMLLRPPLHCTSRSSATLFNPVLQCTPQSSATVYTQSSATSSVLHCTSQCYSTQ